LEQPVINRKQKVIRIKELSSNVDFLVAVMAGILSDLLAVSVPDIEGGP